DERAHPVELLLELGLGFEIPRHLSLLRLTRSIRRLQARGTSERIAAKRASRGGATEACVTTQNRSRRIASSTIAATASGDLPSGPVRESRMTFRICSPAGVRSSDPNASGLFRSACVTSVATEPGHNTETPIGLFSAASSSRRVSESDTTPT